MDLCSYPYPTLLDGVPSRVPGYRLLSPLHTGGCQATRMGDTLSPQHQRGRNLTYTRNQVIQDIGYAPISCPPIPLHNNMLCKFLLNGSHACVVNKQNLHMCFPFKFARCAQKIASCAVQEAVQSRFLALAFIQS